jgi:hypothetical protein
MAGSITTSGQDRESRRQFWQQHVENWQKSGLNLAAYCRQHGLKHYQLRYWKSRLSEDPAGVSFVPLQLSANLPVPISYAPLRLHTPNGFSIDVSGGFDPIVLRQLIAAVQQI